MRRPRLFLALLVILTLAVVAGGCGTAFAPQATRTPRSASARSRTPTPRAPAATRAPFLGIGPTAAAAAETPPVPVEPAPTGSPGGTGDLGQEVLDLLNAITQLNILTHHARTFHDSFGQANPELGRASELYVELNRLLAQPTPDAGRVGQVTGELTSLTGQRVEGGRLQTVDQGKYERFVTYLSYQAIHGFVMDQSNALNLVIGMNPYAIPGYDLNHNTLAGLLKSAEGGGAPDAKLAEAEAAVARGQSDPGSLTTDDLLALAALQVRVTEAVARQMGLQVVTPEKTTPEGAQLRVTLKAEEGKLGPAPSFVLEADGTFEESRGGRRYVLQRFGNTAFVWKIVDLSSYAVAKALGSAFGSGLRGVAAPTKPVATAAPPPTAVPFATAQPGRGLIRGSTGQVTFCSGPIFELQTFVVNPDGTGLAQLTDRPGGACAEAWSPDWSRFTFLVPHDRYDEIYVMQGDGSSARRLTDSPGNDLYADWSPDGSRIVYLSHKTGDSEIFVMQADGSDQVNLTNNPASDSYPHWSPDGGRIAFTSERDQARGEVYVMNADGSGVIRLTRNEDEEWDPTWSPDGTQLLYMARTFHSDNDWTWNIYAVGLRGGEPTPLTADSEDNTYPVWSPDGSRIAFISKRDGQSELYVMDADGSNPVRLTTGPDEEQNAHWSPDGTRIAFTSWRTGNGDIYIINPDGSGLTRLTTGDRNDFCGPWRP